MLDFDFIPAEYHVDRCQRHAVHLRATLVGLLLIMMALWLTAHHHQLSRADAMMQDVQEQQGQIKIHQLRKDAMEREEAQLRDRQRLLNELESATSALPGFLMGGVFSDSEASDRLGRFALWSSREDADRASAVDRIMALRSELHRRIQAGHVESLFEVSGVSHRLPA